MPKNGNVILFGLLLVATIYLMSDPRCGRGCKTVLQHLLSCELEALF